MADARLKCLALAAGVFGLDRLTKWSIDRYVSFSDDYKIIPGFFDIVHSENRGVAFGIFNDSESPFRTALLIVLSVVAVVAVSGMLWRAKRPDGQLWAFALILGGAAGNLLDRMISGQVTDFLLFYIGAHQWPSFNVADSAIVIGCGLLILNSTGVKHTEAHG